MGKEKWPQRKDAWIEIDKINVLPQVRRTFNPEDIQALAESICDWNGLIEKVVIIIYSRKLCQEYIKLTNRIHESHHQIRIENLIKIQNGQFAIMVSGEQRLRAHKLIWEEGCLVCRAKYGQEKPGVCFARHLGKEKRIEASLRYNVPVFKAIDLQLAGNSGIHPPEQETMEVLTRQFRLKKEKNSKLTIAEFARSINKNPSTISDYLKVFELPEEVFYYFREKYISFGIAREIAFLKDNGENNLAYWALRAISKEMKLDAFHKLIREHLKNKHQSVFEIFDEKSEQASRKMHIRKTVAAEMVAYLHAKDAHWKKFLQLYDEGKLGKKDSPFSIDSPRTLFKKEIDFIKNHVTPHMRLHLPKKSLADVEKTLIRMELMMTKLEKKIENR